MSPGDKQGLIPLAIPLARNNSGISVVYVEEMFFFIFIFFQFYLRFLLFSCH